MRDPKQIGGAEFWAEVHGEAINGMTACLQRYPDATHVMIYENVDLSSSLMGHTTFLAVGPSNTYTTLEQATAGHPTCHHSWAYYPKAYALAEDIRATTPPPWVEPPPAPKKKKKQAR